MNNDSSLKRFLDAQARDYHIALTEIKGGYKRSHWMWCIFPQIAGLGYSEMTKRFAIKDLSEAAAYLEQPLLGPRPMEVSNALLKLPSNNAAAVIAARMTLSCVRL